jgi:predicted transcriptional regulator
MTSEASVDQPDERGDIEGILGPLEAEVLRVVWDLDRPVSVRTVLEQLNRERAQPLAYTTVMTVLTKLAKKGVLQRRQNGRAYLYEATVTDAASIAVRGVLGQFGEVAVARFVDEARSDPELRQRLERLMGTGGSGGSGG